MGASTSWNPQGLSRPVMGLFYLYLYLSSSECEVFSSRVTDGGIKKLIPLHFSISNQNISLD